MASAGNLSCCEPCAFETVKWGLLSFGSLVIANHGRIAVAELVVVVPSLASERTGREKRARVRSASLDVDDICTDRNGWQCGGGLSPSEVLRDGVSRRTPFTAAPATHDDPVDPTKRYHITADEGHARARAEARARFRDVIQSSGAPPRVLFGESRRFSAGTASVIRIRCPDRHVSNELMPAGGDE